MFDDSQRDRCNLISGQIIGAAIEVHSAIGPGLLESAYERCLARELQLRGLACRRQVPVKMNYKGVILDEVYRLDFLVEEVVVVEVKSVDAVHPIHLSQVKTYLRLQQCWLGLVVNFNVRRLVDGVRRVVV